MVLLDRRKSIRTKAGKDTRASVNIFNSNGYDSQQSYLIRGYVENIGPGGMLLKTHEFIPVPAKADMIINFDSKHNSSEYSLNASGETVRITDDGVGIKFTSIDLAKLQKCIIHKINQDITLII